MSSPISKLDQQYSAVARSFSALIFMVLFLALALTQVPALGDEAPLITHFLNLNYGEQVLNLRVGVQTPAGSIRGDILYIHGFADRLDNHGPLFAAWVKNGFRVIAFDLPSHGENSGSYNNLNNFDFQQLADLASKVEQETKPTDMSRPLILSGWSTGGLIAVRILQKKWDSSFSRPVAGAILFAPGVSVHSVPWTFGDRLGFVTNATLTHDPNPPHHGIIKPDSPFWSPLITHFTPLLAFNSTVSDFELFPTGLPTLVLAGGDKEDMYAKSEVVLTWVDSQNFYRSTDDLILAVQCPHAMHELDNELPSFGGDDVRSAAAEFALQIIKGPSPLNRSLPSGLMKVCAPVKPKNNFSFFL